jgi:glutamyl-tRNA reductase
VIVVAGLSHHTAPIAIRERFAFQSDELEVAVRELLTHDDVHELAVLNTCNRVELIAACPDSCQATVQEHLVEFLGRRAAGARKYFYIHEGEAAVRHAFRVASSLDSLVVGEPQILGQVKGAFDSARTVGSLGQELNRLAVASTRTAKRVRTETSIGEGQVSVPSVAVDLARQIFGELKGRRVGLLGSGDMGNTVAQLLADEGAQITVVGRTFERTSLLAKKVGGDARSMTELPEALAGVDVVVTSTSAPHHVVSRDVVADLRKARRGRSLFIIDLAVPRDVDPESDELDNVFLYNIDDFAKILATSHATRAVEAQAAEAIVASEVERFGQLNEIEQVTPAIVALRDRFESVMERELERTMKGRLRHLGEDERAAIERMLDSALKKILHSPSVSLRQSVMRPDSSLGTESLVNALDELFHANAPPESMPGSQIPSVLSGSSRADRSARRRDQEHDSQSAAAADAADDDGDARAVRAVPSSKPTGTGGR